jgi:hypothetical protein
MYADSIVQQRIELASEQLGFIPEYHTPEEIDQFEMDLQRNHEQEHLAAARAAQGVKEPVQAFQTVLTRLLCNPLDPKLTSDEVRWMQNERALVMADAAYFLTRYYKMLWDDGVVRRFTFRSGQKIFFNAVAELESAGIAIEILLAKARQLGMTTVVAGMLLLKSMFSHGTSAVTASADGEKTREMGAKLFTAYDKLPWWLRTPYTKRSEGEKGYLKWGSIDAGIFFQHGEQRNPVAMGTTITAYHLSEVSNYADRAKELIDMGLFKAVHPSPRIFGILESTCKGNTGWWHGKYWHAKKHWHEGASRLFALFLPFYCAEDEYPNETERKAHPIPADWKPRPETRQMIAESEMYVQSNPVLAKVLMQDGREWRMKPDQAHYWEWNFFEAAANGDEKIWFQEMPHTDQAAFQGSYDNVFGKDVIAQAFTTRETKYDVFSITGQSIEDRHEADVDDIDYTEARVPVKWASRRGVEFRWELVPVGWVEPFLELADIREDTDEHMGNFFVYLPPEPSYDYSIGVDTSNGIGRDGTVVAVSRRARNAQEQDIQAAEFRDNRVSHIEAFAWGAAIAAYYSRYMTPEWNWNHPFRNPYLSIEQVQAVGDTCQLQMRKMGFGRFHKMTRYDSKPSRMRKRDAVKEGWYTVPWSRPILTDTFVTLVQNQWYKINSAYTIWEADHWEVHYTGGGKTKFEHGDEYTDDGLFANALAAFCPNDMKALADRTAKQYRAQDGQRPPQLEVGVSTSCATFPVSPVPVLRRGNRRLTNSLFRL